MRHYINGPVKVIAGLNCPLLKDEPAVKHYIIWTREHEFSDVRRSTYFRIETDSSRASIRFLQHTPVFIPEMLQALNYQWNPIAEQWERHAVETFYNSPDHISQRICHHLNPEDHKQALDF